MQISIQLNPSDYEYFKYLSSAVGLSPSQCLRTMAIKAISDLKLCLLNDEISFEDLKSVFDS